MLTQRSKYVIRVYALILNEKKEVLLSDEYLMDMKMTKFPGGGMEYGEGTLDCLRREAMEEFGQELTGIRHFYTTDYYQEALFYEDHQLLSIYYLAGFTEKIGFPVSDKPFDFPGLENGAQSFRWAAVDLLPEEDLTFPIDRLVLGKLKEYVRSATSPE
jgi:8-oxo-dGTP pyrophosphatase MutT (NUDIX family)